MDTEDFANSASWISTKVLRDTADLKQSVKKTIHRKSASVLPNSLPVPVMANASVIAEKNLTPKGSHQRFNTVSFENVQGFKPLVNDSHMQDKKCLHQIARLNQEILILSGELKQANEVISQLSMKIVEMNAKHTQHLQALQERHEQKLKRNQQEIEFLIKSCESYKNAGLEKAENEFKAILNKQQESFDAKIKTQERNHYEEIYRKESELKQHVSVLRQHFIETISNLKSKFVEELDYVESKYKNKIQIIMNFQRKSSGYCEVDEEGSTIVEIESDKAKVKDLHENLDEDFSNYFREKLLKEEEQHQNFEFTIMKLLNQLK